SSAEALPFLPRLIRPAESQIQRRQCQAPRRSRIGIAKRGQRLLVSVPRLLAGLLDGCRNRQRRQSEDIRRALCSVSNRIVQQAQAFGGLAFQNANLGESRHGGCGGGVDAQLLLVFLPRVVPFLLAQVHVTQAGMDTGPAPILRRRAPVMAGRPLPVLLL